ncbi:MAG TPA: rhamnogalacturonan acetylesterase [Verrucomicrobiae bacterium]|nr:rhamnogalacturonan acetylesterase [Verrucomicrobiae bacterium]
MNSLAGGSKNPLHLVIIGDSTVCNYPVNSPKRGWGQFIQGYFDDGVKVINLARSGRSTKTFIKEGLWKKALAEKPDVVLIQFGHNDSHDPSRPEATDANTDYRTNLCIYIDETRAAGAMPVLVTPMVRRTFDKSGKMEDPLQRYADAMKEVGAEKKVPVIDLHGSSKAIVEPMGEKESMEKMACDPKDHTHFNEAGAKMMAELVMKELPAACPVLKSHLKK